MANEFPIYNGLLQSNLVAGNNSITGLGGATLTAGHITLFQDPTAALHAVTKQYADAIAGSASPQRGLVAGTGLNFAQNADYTTGRIPLATGATTMGFSADLAWDDTLKSMTVNGVIGEIQQIFFDTGFTPLTTPVGSMWWNSQDSTINVKVSSNVTAQLSQEALIHGYNDTGSTIAQGAAVAVVGSLLGDVEFGLASNATYDEALGFVGIATEDIATGTKGFVCRLGLVRGLNTNAWNEGDRLYLGTAGALQNTKPAAPATTVAVALVVVKSATEGILLTDFRIEGNQIDSASDYIESGARTAGSLLVRNAANTAWTDTADKAYFIDATPALFSERVVVGTSTALSSGSNFTVRNVLTHTSGTQYGLVSSTQLEAPSASTGTMVGAYLTGNTTNSAASSLTAATVNGLLINYGHSNTTSNLGTFKNLYNYAIQGPGAGTVTDFYGADFYCDVQGGAGRVTNLYELQLRSYVPSTYATNHWGIYQSNAAASNCFAGRTLFGTTGKASSTVHLDYAQDPFGSHTNGLRLSTTGNANAFMLTHSYTDPTVFGIKYVTGNSFPLTVKQNAVHVGYQDHVISKPTWSPVLSAYRTVPNGSVGSFEGIMECARDTAQIGPYDAYAVVGRFVHTSGLLIGGSDTAGVYGVQEWNSTAGGNGGTISSGVFGEVIGASTATYYPSQLVGVRARMSWGSDTAQVSSIYGFKLENMSVGTGGVGTSYGLYLGNQVGTTKYGVYQADSTATNVFNGITNFTGAVNISGNPIGNISRGELYQNDTGSNTTMTLQNTWYPVAGTWTDSGVGFQVTVNTTNGRVTPTRSGIYHLTWHISGFIAGVTNQDINGGILKNGTIVNASQAEQLFVGNGDTYGFSGTCLISFNGTTDYVELAVNNNTSPARVLTLDHATITVARVGDI